jgi:hypothetical protein
MPLFCALALHHGLTRLFRPTRVAKQPLQNLRMTVGNTYAAGTASVEANVTKPATGSPLSLGIRLSFKPDVL